MAKDQYENETCLGCVDFIISDEIDVCMNHNVPANPDEWPDRRDRCKEFEPTFQCRHAMAAERSVNVLKEIANQIQWIGYINAGGKNPPPVDRQ